MVAGAVQVEIDIFSLAVCLSDHITTDSFETLRTLEL